MGNNNGKVHTGINLVDPMVPDNTVMGFQLLCSIGTLFSALYYATSAYRSKNGPQLGDGKYMKDYSGHFAVRRTGSKKTACTCTPYPRAMAECTNRAVY